MTRLIIPRHAPEGFQAVLALNHYLAEQLDHELLGVVKLRASQMNKCAYCVDMHATDLERIGVPTRKIYAVSAWRETTFFSSAERAALALAEEVTALVDGVDEATWAQAAQEFTEKELSDLILAIGFINLTNRMGVSTHLAPPPLRN